MLTVNFATAWALPIVWAQQQIDLSFSTKVQWALWLVVGFVGIFPGIVAYMVWAERKVAARFQDRIGPNRVGPLGLLQPIADALKLITKENIVPKSADQLVHLLAPVVLLVSAFLVLAVVPFGLGTIQEDHPAHFNGLVPIDPPSGLLYLIAVSSLGALGIFLAGWSSRNKYSLLGAMRAVAQLVSYEIPQVLSMVPVVLWTGSLSMVAIMNQQLDHGWFLWSPPGLLAFSLLLIASLAEVNRTPFDLPEAESEIIAGYHTEYSGMRFGLFFLAEYLSVFAVCCLTTVIFLGGGSLPFSGLLPFLDYPRMFGGVTTTAYLITNLISVAVFAAKVFFLIFVMFWIRATLPRMRVDRLMNFAWKYMVPLSLINILIAAVWFECAIRSSRPFAFAGISIPGWILGWVVTLPLVGVSVWFCFWFNRRERTALLEAAKPRRAVIVPVTAR
ncbi:NADH-quinone oxidoreductase subunit NuoH [Singulisphaera sp. GP187]|uniref:NADH-quinone oxidoreductase subunit NuoH n=1 Tax=Singulisphaera sp. GP187 TaxID=1882752 RepID=UPI0009413430|nr:NADH-quinone oxidoreductase subunit NuoH [Singulisphaera sp. GP187]